MNLIPCRDCGNMIDPSSRGCPKCARNLDAERMIDRFVWCGLVLAVIVAAAVAVLFYLRH
jgi:RNA polymerase subunit RPABC4/transcription elongation factor Spt4